MIRLAPLPPNIREKFGPLTDFLHRNRNILFAYLFGGLAKGRFNPLSDIDLALFLKGDKKVDYLETLGV